MKHSIIYTSGLLVLGLLTACGGGQKKAEVQVSSIPGIPNAAVDSFNQGVRLIKSDKPNYRKALAAFNEASRLHPTYRVAKLNAAICLEKTGQYRAAADVYESLVKDYVEDPSVFMAYGNALLLSDQSGPAIEQFEKVISLDDKNLEAKNNLAAAYLRKGEGERSREFVKEVLAIQPDNVPALINLGMYYQSKKNMELALLMFNNALGHETSKGKPVKSAEPAAAKTKNDKAKNGKAKNGKAKAPVAVKTNPGTPNPIVMARAHNNIGMTYFMMGVIPNAVHHFKQAVKFDSSMNEARMNLASIFLDYLAYGNALKEFQVVLDSNPSHYEAMIGTADALYGTAKYKEAAELFEQSSKVRPSNVEAMTRLAEIYHKKLNDTGMAIKTYQRIQSDAGLASSDAAYKKAGQQISSIQVEIQAAKQFEKESKNKAAAPAPEGPAPESSEQ
jgi:tetratricopeptide (TPR) repeat protein